MGLVFAIILITMLLKNSDDVRRSDLFRKFLGTVIGVSIIGSLIPGMDVLVTLGAIGGIGYYLSKNAKKKRADQERARRYGWDAGQWDRNHNNTRAYDQSQQWQNQGQQNNDPFSQASRRAMDAARAKAQQAAQRVGNAFESAQNMYNTQYGNNSTSSQNPYRNQQNQNGPYANRPNGQPNGQPNNQWQNPNAQQYTTLPKSISKRRKILDAFNEKYKLYITEEQASSIVNSSYVSVVWRRELEAMNRKYATAYEWFQGPTGWLRVYMHAFHNQELTSDIQQQETICMYAFESIFQYVDSLKGLPLSQKIELVNDRFMTSFDDASFMIAYRFLASKGLSHELIDSDFTKNVDEVDDLVEKYQKMESE